VNRIRSQEDVKPLSGDTLTGLIASSLASFILGILTKLFGDRLAEAKLEMARNVNSFFVPSHKLNAS
jgi:NAD(P)H-hydrate repair Nnr-like enzyme with NAD(P)H-hydrate dehydratase domain